MSSEPVSVIIVAAGSKDYLECCLDSLAGQGGSPLEVIVVNNTGTRDLEIKAKDRYPACRVVTPDRFVSYAEALNAGIGASMGEYILCLNDDTVLEKDFVARAIAACALNERIGMVSGKILRSDARTIDSTGLFLSPWRTAKERGYGKKDKGQFDAPGYVFGVTGAVAFYRRRMLEEIKDSQGYFAAQRGFFYEDLDVAWRAQRQGWKAYYTPQAVAFHARGATARAPASRSTRWARRYISDELLVDLIKNRYATIKKNDSLLGFLAHLPFIALYDIVAWGHIVFFRPKAAVKFFRRAHKT